MTSWFSNKVNFKKSSLFIKSQIVIRSLSLVQISLNKFKIIQTYNESGLAVVIITGVAIANEDSAVN